MNVFVIPSWYPSGHNVLNGIFVKEQVTAMARVYDDINFGVSTWGQNDEQFLLYAGKPLSSLQKVLKRHSETSKAISHNFEEYFNPSFSFSNKVLRGNIKSTIQANYNNFKAFENRYGKPDLIHAHVSYKAGYIAQQISKMTDIPYVITEHMGPFPQKYHLTDEGNLQPHIKSAIDDCNTMIAVSTDLRKVIKSYGILRDILVIPNFIEPVALKSDSILNSDPFVFVTVSGMSQGKGINELLHGISQAVLTEPNMHFVMVGDGPDLSMFKSLADSLNISSHITWTGMVKKENVRKYFIESNAHILTSHYDSFGVAYIEAMAHGLPNIAANIGGPKDIIDHQTGILVESVEPESIAEKIIWMKNNYSIFDRSKIISSFLSRFSTEAVLPQLRKVYEELVS